MPLLSWVLAVWAVSPSPTRAIPGSMGRGTGSHDRASPQLIGARTSVGCPSTQASALSWGLPSCCVNSTDGNSLIRPSRVFLDGGGRRCVGLLGETRSPENQQSRGSCPGAPAPGNPEGRAGWELAERAKSEKMCSGPRFWPLGGIVLTFLQGAGQLTLIPLPKQTVQAREGTAVSTFCLHGAHHPEAQGGSTILGVRPRVQVTAQSLYPVSVSSTPLCLCFVIHPMGRDYTCLYPAVYLALSAVLAM